MKYHYFEFKYDHVFISIDELTARTSTIKQKITLPMWPDHAAFLIFMQITVFFAV